MAFKMKGNPYKMGGHKTKATMAYMKNMKSPLEQASVDHQEIKDRLKGEDLTEAERQEILAKLKAAYEKEKESKEKAPTEMKSPMEQAKPDYPDIDGDGNTTESMKQAAADKKSPMEQKLNENPNAQTAGYWRGYTDPGRTVSGNVATTRNEDKFYKENPYMSPTADEQDIFVGKDIEETRSQYKPHKGKLYAMSETGQPVTMQQDISGNHMNDMAFINYAKKLEREKEMRESEDQ